MPGNGSPSPLDLSIGALRRALRAGELTIPDVAEASLERIRATASLNAYVDVDEERTRAAASAQQALLDAGYDLGPLHGVPTAIKDNIDLRGYRITVGSSILADNRPEHDAAIAHRLRRAGALVVGTTNMHEFAWGGTTENPHTGRTANAWDPARMPAGSSGGSGVAVATRSALLALGTDTGGSIRLPASMNGITGLRPSIGALPTEGIFPLGFSMDTVGPMTVSVADTAVAFRAMRGVDGSTPTGDLAGLRVGVVAGFSLTMLQPGVEAAVRAAMETLASLGATVREVVIPDIAGAVDAQLVAHVEPSVIHRDWLLERPTDYGDDVRALLEAEFDVRAVDYIQAQRFRAGLREQFLRAFRDVDVLLMPTQPFTAPPAGLAEVVYPDGREEMLAGLMRFTAPASMTGTPAISIPAGFDGDGLPVGLQLIAPPRHEERLFQVGEAFEEATRYALAPLLAAS